MLSSLCETSILFVPQMNRPIQVKPADSEGRGGETQLNIVTRMCARTHISVRFEHGKPPVDYMVTYLVVCFW